MIPIPHYRKWLRYYLDFCQKYGFRQSDTKSLPHFIKKLKEKKPICNKNKLLMQYTYIMVKKRDVKIRTFYLRPITR